MPHWLDVLANFFSSKKSHRIAFLFYVMLICRFFLKIDFAVNVLSYTVVDLASARLTVALADFKGLFQPESMIL